MVLRQREHAVRRPDLTRQNQDGEHPPFVVLLEEAEEPGNDLEPQEEGNLLTRFCRTQITERLDLEGLQPAEELLGSSFRAAGYHDDPRCLTFSLCCRGP